MTNADENQSFLTIEGSLKLPNITEEANKELGCLQVSLNDEQFTPFASSLIASTTGIYGETFPLVQIDVYMLIDQDRILLEPNKPTLISSFAAESLHIYSKQVCFEAEYSEAPLQVYVGEINIQYVVEVEQLQGANCELGAESNVCILDIPNEINPGNQGTDAQAEDTSETDQDNETGGNDSTGEDAYNDETGEGTQAPEQEEQTNSQDEDQLDPAQPEEIAEEPQADDEDLYAECEALSNANKPGGKPITKSASLMLEENSYKITGDNSTVMFYLGQDLEIDAACLMLTGNQANAQIIVDGKVNKLIIVGRGNQPIIEMLINEGANIGSIVTDFRGNEPKFHARGPGEYTCPDDLSAGEAICE